MVKYILLVLILLSTTVTADDSKWYIGFGVGQSIPKLRLDEEITGVVVDVPDELGGGELDIPVAVDSEFSTYGQKIFLGYDVGDEKGWAFELSLTNFGNYTSTLSATANGAGTILNIPFSLSVSGQQNIDADLYARTFSTIYSFRVSDRVSIFPRFGIAHIRGTVTTRENIIGYVETPDEDFTEVYSQSETSELSGVLPIFGFGVDVQVNKNHFVRVEAERYGDPSDEYVDMFTIQWGYRFK